jgi:hypothetical protein
MSRGPADDGSDGTGGVIVRHVTEELEARALTIRALHDQHIYAHVMPLLQRDAADKVDSLLRGGVKFRYLGDRLTFGRRLTCGGV